MRRHIKKTPRFFQILYKYLMSKRWYILVLFVFVILFVAFTQEIIAIMFIAFYAFIGSFGQIYRRNFEQIPPSIEFVTFGTVMISAVYGMFIGILFGVIITLSSEIISGKIDVFVINYLAGRIVIAVAAALLAGLPVLWLGLIMTVLYNIVAQLLYALQPDFELRAKLFFYLATNIPFNFIIFAKFGPFFMDLMRSSIA